MPHLGVLLGVQEVPGSNPGGPTKRFKQLEPSLLLRLPFWSPNGRHAVAWRRKFTPRSGHLWDGEREPPLNRLPDENSMATAAHASREDVIFPNFFSGQGRREREQIRLIDSAALIASKFESPLFDLAKLFDPVLSFPAQNFCGHPRDGVAAG